jgi:hypothetical protein
LLFLDTSLFINYITEHRHAEGNNVEVAIVNRNENEVKTTSVTHNGDEAKISSANNINNDGEIMSNEDKIEINFEEILTDVNKIKSCIAAMGRLEMDLLDGTCIRIAAFFPTNFHTNFPTNFHTNLNFYIEKSDEKRKYLSEETMVLIQTMDDLVRNAINSMDKSCAIDRSSYTERRYLISKLVGFQPNTVPRT